MFVVMEPLGPYRSMTAPLAAPPRQVPWTVRVPLLLGGRMAQLGWMLLLLGTCMVSVYAPDMNDRLAYRHGRQTSPARVTAVSCAQHTRRPPDGCSSWREDFSFAADGQSRMGYAYSSYGPIPVGTTTTADFPRGRPERARIAGTWRHRDHDAAAAPLIMLFGFGAGVLFFATRPGRRAIMLLRRGAVARGRLVDKQPTRARVNQRRVYRYTFEFEPDDGGKYHVSARTHLGVLEDEPTEQILYLRDDPSIATVLDHLPGAPHVLDDGTIASRSDFPAAAYLFLVALFVGFNAYSLFVIFR